MLILSLIIALLVYSKADEVKALVVTSFTDIGRSKWASDHSQWTRSTETYISYFKPMLKLPFDVVCYITRDIIPLIKKLTTVEKIYEYNKNLTYFNHTYAKKIKAIMNSNEYKALVHHRKNPENSVPRYTMVTNSKPCILKEAAAATLGLYTHYIWIDFGYFRDPPKSFPSGKVNTQAFNDGKIHVTVFKDIRPVDTTDTYITNLVALAGAEIVQGGFYTIPAELVDWFEAAWRGVLDRMLALNLIDDDQTVAEILITENRDKFVLHINKQWFNDFQAWLV